MKMKSMVAVLAVAACGLMATAACAQSTTGSGDSKSITLRIGANLPTNSSAKDSGNTWVSGGLDYTPQKSGATAGTPSELIYGDYTGSSKNGQSARYYAIGVGTRAKASSASNATGHGAFYDGGFGAYFQTAKNSAGQSKSGTAFGLKTGIGLSLGSSLFVEGTYTYILTKVNSVNLSGFGTQVGLAF